MIKKIIKKILPEKNRRRMTQYYGLLKWYLRGRPSPPPYLYKRKIIKRYSKKHTIDILIETGTYYGDTIEELKNNFKKIFSIELDRELYQMARTKFDKYSHIKIFNGDSGEILKHILDTVSEKSIFWLDGHYSAGVTAKGDLNTPIIKELATILNHQNKEHIILIDDARCFNGENDYPTINQLEDYVHSINKNLLITTKFDIIRITR